MQYDCNKVQVNQLDPVQWLDLLTKQMDLLTKRAPSLRKAGVLELSISPEGAMVTKFAPAPATPPATPGAPGRPVEHDDPMAAIPGYTLEDS